MRTILHDIFAHNPGLLEQFVSATDGRGFIKGSNLEWHQDELKEVFRILTGLDRWKPTIILADALDEGSRNETRSLLSLFEAIFPDDTRKPFTQIRVLFSSRHYPNIVIKNCPELWAEKNNLNDIETFTRRKLADVSQSLEDRALMKSVLDQSNGVFLWVDLVTNSMLLANDDGKTFIERMTILEQTPHELDGLYGQIFSRLSEQERHETFHIFKWVIYATRKMSPRELCFALQFDALGSISTYDSWRKSGQFVARGTQMSRFIRSRSCGLLEVRRPEHAAGQSPNSEAVQFIHHTVPEFLSRKGFKLLHPDVGVNDISGTSHFQMVSTCFRYLARPEMITCPSMTVLRYSVSQGGHNFLDWVQPFPDWSDASRARALLIAQYGSESDAPLNDRGSRGSTLKSLSMIEDHRVVFYDLPLLRYSVDALETHLRLGAPSFQPRVFDILLELGSTVLPFWYSFQDAWYLPRIHHFHTIVWDDFVQSIVAFGLEHCISELRQRVSGRSMAPIHPKKLARPLTNAVNQGLMNMVRDLVACGADPNLRGQDHYCPLDDAVMHLNVQMVRTLIQNGARARTSNQFGFTPLHHAATVDDAATAAVLVEAGAEIEARLKLTGETPLLLAAVHDRVRVLKALLSLGADRLAVDIQKRDLRDLALLHDSASVHAFLNAFLSPVHPLLPRLRHLEMPIDRSMTASPTPERQDEILRLTSSRFNLG